MMLVALIIFGFCCASLGYMLGWQQGRRIGWMNGLSTADALLSRIEERDKD